MYLSSLSESIAFAPAAPKLDDRGISDLLNEASGSNMRKPRQDFRAKADVASATMPKFDDRGARELLNAKGYSGMAQLHNSAAGARREVLYSNISESAVRAFKENLPENVSTKLSDIAGNPQQVIDRLKMKGRVVTESGGYNAFI
ncbi:hypothetical protein [Halodesulfovibrio sp.]|jgi:hypothetical protein|uniref:hypothetical protein n=1 Tax=Halodesulfovibrio sp. TaxID=1912772 RepID=UPI0025D05DBC|nr:hypothetical protein [Halodesulfovibrio sp.]MCT4628083.1 hypothetical protein [Halodesulfovibrio sp.]